MDKTKFFAYVASFDPKYATEQTARDLIKQAKKINEETKDSSN